jgi:hypothetical protein
LWALSLAHSQLADVFFSMLIEGSLEQGGWGNVFMVKKKKKKFKIKKKFPPSKKFTLKSIIYFKI